MKLDLSIVIPAWEEAENLQFLLPEIHKTAGMLTKDHEVLVVDTKEAMDETEQICNQFGTKTVRRYPSNSYGDAVRTGIKHSLGCWILFMDADGSHDPSFIIDLWNERKDVSVVIASRYTEGGKTVNPFLLILMSLFINNIYRYVLGIPCKDISNSFRLYPGIYLRNLNLKCNDFDIIEEILCKLSANKQIEIKELPFCFKKRQKGKTKRNLWKFAFSYIKTLLYLKNLKKEYIRGEDSCSS